MLSTVRSDQKTYIFNFDDLPCPPPEVGWNATAGSYRPRIAPGDFLFDLDPAFKNCTPGYLTGNDPPKPLTPGKNHGSPPGGPGHPRPPPRLNLLVVEGGSEGFSINDNPFRYFPNLQPEHPQKRRGLQSTEHRADENTRNTVEVDLGAKDPTNKFEPNLENA